MPGHGRPERHAGRGGERPGVDRHHRAGRRGGHAGQRATAIPGLPPPVSPDRLRERGQAAERAEARECPRTDRHRRGRADDPQHVVEAPRCVQISDQEGRAGQHPGEGQVAPGAHHRTLRPLPREVGDGGDDLRSACQPADEVVARDQPAPVARLDRGPVVVACPVVASRAPRPVGARLPRHRIFSRPSAAIGARSRAAAISSLRRASPATPPQYRAHVHVAPPHPPTLSPSREGGRRRQCHACHRRQPGRGAPGAHGSTAMSARTGRL